MTSKWLPDCWKRSVFSNMIKYCFKNVQLHQVQSFSNIFVVSELQKEHDLELAARIGQTLLSQNKSLKSKNDELKIELASCNDTVSTIIIILLSLPSFFFLSLPLFFFQLSFLFSFIFQFLPTTFRSCFIIFFSI